MVKLYVDLIKKDLWTLERVPAIWYVEVKAVLEKEDKVNERHSNQ